MKHIIIPIFRFLLLLVIYSIMYPILFVLGLVVTAWEGKWVNPLSEDFITEDSIYPFRERDYWVYITPLDWFLKRKSWRNKEGKLLDFTTKNHEIH